MTKHNSILIELIIVIGFLIVVLAVVVKFSTEGYLLSQKSQNENKALVFSQNKIEEFITDPQDQTLGSKEYTEDDLTYVVETTLEEYPNGKYYSIVVKASAKGEELFTLEDGTYLSEADYEN
jgi:Tfp pilus assembly protein PilE